MNRTQRQRSEKKVKRKSRCQLWLNTAVNALIPLMIGVATIVIAIADEKIEDKRREQDHTLAYLTRLQDQQLADESYYQNVFKTYVDDISNVLFKINHSFIDNEKKLKYIRTKTLTALDELDFQRKSRLFLFLYETDLLSTNTADILLDLSGANFTNITIKSTPYKKLSFNKLYLPSVDLTNASFIDCVFKDGADFRNSSMFGIKFLRTKFECSKSYLGSDDALGKTHVRFDGSNIEKSDFSESHLCDISFKRTNLALTVFHGIKIQGMIQFQGTNLFDANRNQSIDKAEILGPLFIDFSNIDFRTIPINITLFNPKYFQMNNVILIDEMWIIDQKIDCLNWFNNHILTHWQTNYIQGSCSFNFTVKNVKIGIDQTIDIAAYAVFIDSDETEYNFSADVRCMNGNFVIEMNFYDITSIWFNTSKSYLLINNTFTWKRQFDSGKIPRNTRSIRICIERFDKEECLIDNMELYIQKRKLN
ncbi:unnamed protein product [Adineta ricciae]|uniref:Pentapeptide repeat-containing protein n=1 Tax=Adineta ricciae TaxID=249248 RepID=A0A815N8R8_ADIRI|nr:unnamed protein product [Adineta ricciae]